MAEAEGVVVVRGSAQGFVQEISAGRHHLVADEQAHGGRSQVSGASDAHVSERYPRDDHAGTVSVP